MPGEPMVLLHGITDTPRTWDLVRERLAAEHDLHAFTLLGHSGGAELTGEATMEAVVDQAERDMDAAGLGTAHLVGNSLGGGVALLLAARGRARTVVGLAPAGGWLPDDPAQHDVVAFFKLAQDLLRHAAPQADEIASTPEGRARALAMMVERPEHVPADLVAHQIRSAAACPIVMPLIERTAADGWDDPDGIDVPVRIVWGTEDKVLAWPKAAARFRQRLPDADWVVLDGVGHLPQLDVPDRTAELILEWTAR